MTFNASQLNEVTSSLNDKNAILVSNPNSAISVLINTAKETVKPKFQSSLNESIGYEISDELTNLGPTFGNLITAAATNIANEINTKLKYTKGTIISIFNKDAEEIITKIEQLKNSYGTEATVTVKYAKTLSILNDDDFNEFINLSSKRGSGDEHYNSFNYPEKTNEEIIELLSKNKLFNEYGKELLEDTTSDLLIPAYNLALSGYTGSVNKLSASNDLVLNILSILISQTLLDYVDPLDGVNVSLNVYNTSLINKAKNISLNLISSYNIIKSFTSKEYVITEVSTDLNNQLVINVNENNLNELSKLDPTITMEVLYGAGVKAAGTDNKITITNLIENKDEYLRTWENYTYVKNASIKKTLFAVMNRRVKDLLTASLYVAPQAEIDAYYESFYPGITINEVPTEVKFELFKKFIDKLILEINYLINNSKMSDFDNLYSFLETFYIKRFYYADFETYIQCYNAAKDTSSDENKIAETATVLYLLNYIIKDVSVVSLSAS